jgi:hypothetical protein
MMSPTESARLASDRLVRSRNNLRQAIRTDQAPATTPTTAPAWFTALDGLKAFLPGFDAVLAALRIGWLQPLRLAGLTLSDVATPLLKPLAQRYPLSYALGGVALGALLVKLRPWRWLPAAAIVSGLAPQAVGNMLRAFPLQSWLATAASVLAKQNQRKPPI